MSERPDSAPASLSDNYEIQRELGRGGAAVVFLARDRKHQRLVAIKLLLPQAASAVSVDRFLREIRIAARLVHPNIVPLIDSAAADGLPYYVMPFVDGETLRARLSRERRLSVEEALRIVREVADALDYAHAVGVVHRDIKPENILLSAGHAVVADFGIAKAIHDATDGKDPPSEKLTEPDRVVGTVDYMSPEQASGEPTLDGRSDLFSLGIVLFELLTGELPYHAASPHALLALRVTEDAPPLLSARPDAPPSVDRAVARALSRAPADRFATVREFASALHEGRTSGEIPAPAPIRPDDRASIVVLPFTNHGADPESEFFSDGMTEEIINALMRLRRLRVVARTSSFALKGKHEDVREIGRRLDVRSVLEGSVRRTGGRLRVSAELINAADGFQVWFGQFDREMGDAIALQDEIAQSIVETLHPTLLGSPAPVRTGADPETYDLYLRGLHFSNQHTPQGFARAGECFAQAIARDPEFALAHAGEADLYAFLSIYGFLAPEESMPRSRAAALRAITLDPAAAEPHAALGTVRSLFEWNWRDATAEFERAITINPQYATAYTRYANYVLTPLGRLDEAMVQLRRAQICDPLSSWVNMSIGIVHYYARRYDEADAALRRVLDLDPNFMLAHFFLGRTLVEETRPAEGIESLKRSLTLSGGNPWATAEIGYAHARAGNRGGAESALNMLRAQSSHQFVSNCFPALVHAALGDTDEAMRAFERGYAEHSHDLPWLGVHPGLDGMRRDPRFMALLKRIGLVS
jgi:eukaryotic-like serine/threonine-protein kinase